MADTGLNVGLIITLIVGVAVSVLVLLFIGSMGGQTFQLLESDIAAIGDNDISGEVFKPIYNSYVKLDHSMIQTGSIVLYNSSNKVIDLGTSNWTVDYDAGRILYLNKTYTKLNNTNTYINYTWGAAEVRASTQGAIQSSFEALEDTGGYLPIIVLAVIIVMILGMVVGFMAVGRIGGGGSL